MIDNEHTYTHLPLLRLPGALLPSLGKKERPECRRVVDGVHHLPHDVKHGLLRNAEQQGDIDV